METREDERTDTDTDKHTHQLFAESFIFGSIVSEGGGDRVQSITQTCFWLQNIEHLIPSWFDWFNWNLGGIKLNVDFDWLLALLNYVAYSFMIEAQKSKKKDQVNKIVQAEHSG